MGDCPRHFEEAGRCDSERASLELVVQVLWDQIWLRGMSQALV